MRLAFAISGAILTVSLVVAAMHDASRDWQDIQEDYKELAISRADSDLLRDAVGQIEPGIKQDFLPQLDRSDRCRTCHLGIENPSMKGAKEPHTAHPGKLLEHHPPERFGCTVCHQGQGMATTEIQAHANKIKFWDEPMLKRPFIEASCEQCHKDVDVKGATVLNDGRRLFSAKGCAGCHKTYGKGGTLGAELTNLGKTSPYTKHPVEENLADYSAMVDGNINLAFILESIKDPKAQPGTTTMPTYALSNWELKALTVYVKSLSDSDLPAAYIPRTALLKPKLTGREVFVRYCSACHGKRGEGGMRIGRMGTALNNEDFLALASKQFIRGVVELGRNSHNKIMPAWGEGAGKLDKDEIDRVVEWVLSWNAPPHSAEDLKVAGGLTDVGRGLYQRACSDCHGARREGKIGPSLLSKELFQIASTRFLYDTVDRGRPGTAMPAWRGLSPAQISSLVLFLLTHDEPYTSENAIPPNGDQALGKQVYMGRCATCHDRAGSGGIGPSLNSPELATLADHAYFARTIAAGRMDSGMPAWSQLPPEQLAGLVAHVRSLGRPIKLENIPVAHGTTNTGKDLFEGVCGQCHGPSGEGGTGPAIGASAFTDIADDRFLAGMTKYGRTGTEMRPHGRVVSSLANFSDEEIMSIVTHLRHPDSKDVIRQTIHGSVDAGREWYNRLCVNCHGARARGGIGPALANPTFLEVASDGFLQAQMALGRSDTEMRPMTPYAGGIVEVERARLNDIISFIRQESLSYGEGGDGTQTAFGSVAHGEQWFSDICAKCHGTDGSGTVAAPGLNDANFLSVASDGFLLGTIIRGRMHTGMRSFGQHGDGIASLTARDVTDIATYIRFWINPLIGPAPPPRSDTGAQWTTTVLAQDIEE